MDVEKTSEENYGNWLAIIIIIVLFGITVGITQYKVPVIMTNIMERYQMDEFAASWLMSIYTLIGFVMAIPSGKVVKKLGPKRAVSLTAIFVLAGGLIGGFAPNTTVLLISRAIEGFAFVNVCVAGSLTIAHYVKPSRLGTANGLWALWVSVGSVLGGVLTPSVYYTLGFSGTWIAYAVVSVVFTVALIFIVKKKDETKLLGDYPDYTRDEPGTEKIKLRELLPPNNIIYLASFTIFNILMIANVSYSPLWMQSNGMDQTLSGFISTLPPLLSILSCPVAGRIADHIGRCKPLYIIGMCVIGPSVFMLLTTTGPTLIVGGVLFGLVGMFVPAVCLTGWERILGSPARVAAGMALLTIFQNIGQFLGTFIAPYLLGPAGDNWFMYGATVCVLGFIGAGLAAIAKFK